jgi:hypothetical protein
MRHITALLLGLFAAVPAFTQTIANVYVQTKAGVRVYNANSSGQLTAVRSTPYAVSGQMEAVRGTGYLISVGTAYLHSYKLATTGGVGAQAAQINTASYGGGECGNTDGEGSILDHTGQYFSVQLWGATDSSGSTVCSAWQTYKIQSNGDFVFLGDAVNKSGSPEPFPINLGTYSSNDNFAYGFNQPEDNSQYQFAGFKRATAGDLVPNPSFSAVGPVPNPAASNGQYYPFWYMVADPASHLAAIVYSLYPPNNATRQVASYTINDSTGAIKSTNTYANMPALDLFPNSIRMSPSGKLLAVGGIPGLELFHFNGASPATVFKANVSSSTTNAEIDQLAWDNNNHLYAISYDSGNTFSTADLYVFTVTSTGVTQAAGSPYKIAGTYGIKGLIVVPR